MAEKIIRDPVHDVIAFRMERPLDRMLFGLLNAAELQRLRRVRQLGMAHLAYPGADHSRYSHSLGVMETARRILDHLAGEIEIDPGRRTVCLVAALLHDLGHGPFSHVFERISGVRHEELTCRVIEDPDSDVHRLLREHEAQLPQSVADLMRCQPGRSVFSDVLCSQLDADRFDYLLRDSLMTGSQYGGFDLRWVIHAMTIDPAGDRLAVTWKGISAVEAYLQSRYHMYRNVYFHKVVRSADGMVKLALQRARRLAVQDRLTWPAPESAVHQALLGRRLSIEQFRDLDDVSLLHCFKVWTGGDDAILAGLCRGLLFRQLYKVIDFSHRQDGQWVSDVVQRAVAAVEEAGGDGDYDLFLDEPADTPYELYGPQRTATAAQEIMVRGPDGRLSEFAAASPFTQGLCRQLSFRRLHVNARYHQTVLEALGSSLQ